MTEQAGDTKQGLLWKQEHLAPLPIAHSNRPTCQRPDEYHLALILGFFCA